MPEIKLIKRTEGEKEAYMQGYNAGYEKAGKMGRVMECKYCKYYDPFRDPMNSSRKDGTCNKLRLTDVGFIAIQTQEDYFCSLFKKKGKEDT